ncbi:MAG: hypothetical protein ABW000_12770 [Actinoplanes sp.]
MAISGNGQPEVGQELNLSGQEVPSPAQHGEIFEREVQDRFHLKAGVGDVSGEVSFSVRGHLRPSAELIVVWISTCGATGITWVIFHFEGVDAWITIVSCVVVAVIAFVSGRAFLRRP